MWHPSSKNPSCATDDKVWSFFDQINSYSTILKKDGSHYRFHSTTVDQL